MDDPLKSIAMDEIVVRAARRLMNIAIALHRHGGHEQANTVTQVALALITSDDADGHVAARDVALAALGQTAATS